MYPKPLGENQCLKLRVLSRQHRIHNSFSCVRIKRVGTRQKGGKKISRLFAIFAKMCAFLHLTGKVA